MFNFFSCFSFQESLPSLTSMPLETNAQNGYPIMRGKPQFSLGKLVTQNRIASVYCDVVAGDVGQASNERCHLGVGMIAG